MKNKIELIAAILSIATSLYFFKEPIGNLFVEENGLYLFKPLSGLHWWFFIIALSLFTVVVYQLVRRFKNGVTIDERKGYYLSIISILSVLLIMLGVVSKPTAFGALVFDGGIISVLTYVLYRLCKPLIAYN